jgi:integrase
MTVLNEKQIRTLNETSPDYPSFKEIKQGYGTYYALFPVAVITGMRRGELLGLRWEDVDFEEKVIRVRKNLLQLRDGTLEYTTPKSEHSIRDIDMYEKVEFFLQRRRDLEEKKRDYLGEAWEGERDLVFSNRFGAPIDPTNVTRKLREALEHTDLPDMRFQDLRHTAATHLVNNIDDPRSAAQVLGHGTVSFTFDRYGDSLPKKRKEAVQNYGDQVFGEDDRAAGA